jgi:hypothetical protein
MEHSVDRLTVGLIRSLNSNTPGIGTMTDLELVQMFGSAAQPLANAIRETVREEVVRALRDV